MTTEPRLLHTGQVIVDLVMQLAQLPAAGRDVFAKNSRFEVGGGFNVMAAARRNACGVTYLGGHGRGYFGDLARLAMRAEAINDNADTGFCIAMTDASAERTFIISSGAEFAISCSTLHELAPATNDIVYISGYSFIFPEKSENIQKYLATWGPRKRIAFDPGPAVNELAADVVEKILNKTAILSCNLDEALAITGRSSVAAAVKALAGLMPRPSAIYIRRGKAGCHLYTGDSLSHIPACQAEAVDSNGAGDAHTGVLLAMLAKGVDPTAAARRANAAAAIAVSRFGPATAPTANEIDRFLHEKNAS